MVRRGGVIVRGWVRWVALGGLLAGVVCASPVSASDAGSEPFVPPTGVEVDVAAASDPVTDGVSFDAPAEWVPDGGEPVDVPQAGLINGSGDWIDFLPQPGDFQIVSPAFTGPCGLRC